MVKQRIRRIIATLLSVMMVAGTGTVNVFADETSIVTVEGSSSLDGTKNVVIEGSSSIEGAQSVIIDGNTGKVTVVDEPQAAKCTCDPVPGLSGNMPHLPNCPTLPVEVGELMKLIDSLPTADEITDETTPEDRAVFADDFAAAMDAYADVLDTVKEMTEDKLTALLGTERMSKLTALMGKLTAATTLENTQMGEVINQALDFTYTNPDIPADCTKVGHTHAPGEECFTWKDKTLTLNGLNLVAPAGSGFGIQLPGGATVYVKSNNSVTRADSATGSGYGIHGTGQLNFDGDGAASSTLTVKGGSTGSESNGIRAGSGLKISKCTINTSGGKTTGLGSSFGVFSLGTVELNECTLTATGDEATLSSSGIVTAGSLEAVNSYITAKGAKGTDSSTGISAGGVNVTAGSLTVIGGEAQKSYGIYAANNIYIGYIDATVEAGKAEQESIGIYSEQNGYLQINNKCKVTVKGGEAASSYGVSTGTITISNGGTLESSSSGTGAIAQAVTVDPNGKVEVVSKDSEGTVPETYDASNLSEYKYMKVTMSLTIDQTLDFVANPESSTCITTLNHTHADGKKCFTWDKDSKTLTLNGLNLAAPDESQYGIKLPDGAKVDVADGTTNSVTVGKTDESIISYLYSIYSDGALTFTGGGTLDVTGGEAGRGDSVGIYSKGALSFTGSGTVNATAGKASSLSYGIFSEGILTIDSGTVNANGGESNTTSAGIGTNNGTIVKGGTVTATGGKSEDDSYGINNGYDVTVSGGTVTANGGEVTVTGAEGNSKGIGLGGVLTVSENGTVNATGGKVTGDNGKSYGVMSWGSVNLRGNLTATGGEASAETYGICSKSPVDISDSGNVTAKGGEATADNGKSNGLFLKGTVSVSGNLTATGGKAPAETCGINGSVMVKDSGNVTAEGGVATAENGKSYGIYSERTDIIDSGKLTATGGEATALGGESYGLYSNRGNGEFKGSGTLTATGGSANKYSYGLYCSGTNNISDTFKLTANGGETTHPEGMSSGICGKGNSLIQFFGSCTVNATGGKAANESNGVSGEKLFFYNGTLTATGGLASNSSYGVNASVSVILLDGVLVASATDNSKIAQATNIKIDVSEYNGATIAASTSADGSNSEVYAESKHDSYKYIMVDVDKTKIYKALNFLFEHPEDSTCITYNNGNLRHTHADGKECFRWNKDSSTLTLNGMELIAPTGGYIGIYLPGGAKVETAPGTVNSVTAGKVTQGNSQGIFSQGKLTFGGSGTLTSTGNEVKSETGGSYGIRSTGGEISIGGSGTVNAIGGQSDNGDSYGIEATGLTVNGGTLVAKTTGTGATAQAVSVAPNTKDYVGAVFAASMNATGTPATDYKAADIATYKYLKVYSNKLASDVDSSGAGTDVVVDEGKLAGAVNTSEELGDPDVTNVKVVLAVKKNDNKPDEDKIKEALNDPNVKADTIGAFFDITLSKHVTKKDGSMETKPVTEAQTPITITITIPEAIRGHKDYQVIRMHNGNAEALETTKDGNNLSFDTGMFSTYAIAYTKDETPPTPPIPPVTTGGSSSSSDDGYSYWMGVKQKVNSSAKGDVVKTNAKSYDQLPASVMTALLDRGVGIVIDWNGGKTITIPAGKALKPEAGRLYYPLSLLEQQFGGMSIVNNTINPETGGTVYIDAKTGTTMPVTGVIVEAPTAETAPNAPIVVTPPTAGMEPEVAATSTGNGIAIAALAALVAMLAGGIWYYRRNYGTK